MQWVSDILGSGIRIYFLLIRLTYIFAKGNDNNIFKPKPKNHSVDNNMLVISLHHNGHKVHGQFFNL